MRYLLISCIWVMYTSSLTSAELSDLFSSGADNTETNSLPMNNADELSFLDNPNVSSNLDDSDLFTSDPVILSTDNVLADKNGFDILDQSFADSYPNKDLSFLLSGTSSPANCLSPLSKTRKTRVRSDSCSDPGQQQQPSQGQSSISPGDAYAAAQERVRDKWCGLSNKLSFANIPVCNMWGGTGFDPGTENSEMEALSRAGLTGNPSSLDESPFKNIIIADLCESFFWRFLLFCLLQPPSLLFLFPFYFCWRDVSNIIILRLPLQFCSKKGGEKRIIDRYPKQFSHTYWFLGSNSDTWQL